MTLAAEAWLMRSSFTVAAIFGVALLVVIPACTSATVGPPPAPPPGKVNGTGHYAGTYYPLYNDGVKQWLDPTSSMPFDKVSHIFAAFAHVYAKGNGAVVSFEEGQPKEADRLKQLEKVARAKNAQVKVLITLGWGKDDWGSIATDYANKAGLFVPSVVALLRENDLDGFDIDDESIGGSTGDITQTAFDAVIAQLRAALDEAGKKDQRSYFLVITPAGDNPAAGGVKGTQIDAKNAQSFDWINVQSYWGTQSQWSDKFVAALKKLPYPASSIAVGVNTEDCTPGKFPASDGLKGIFNWNMTADSACDFKYTLQIAKLVGY